MASRSHPHHQSRRSQLVSNTGERAEVSKDDEIVVIESVKAASDILAPLNGKIVGINEAIVEDPSLVNSDPMGNGWFFKLESISEGDLDSMMTKEQYDAFIS